jgi:hypothetical protein
MDAIAESYVKLVLALGQHDPDYVGAYSGPPEWRPAAGSEERPIPEIEADAARLLERLTGISPGGDELSRLRHSHLIKQLFALRARAGMLSGRRFSSDEESRALSDAVAPTDTEEGFRKRRGKLSRLLPGEGSLWNRYEAYRSAFIIPPEKLDAVFTAAIAEARRRTKAKVALPDGESFRVEYVTDKPWSVSSRYQGGYRSVIQVNTDFPISVDRALDLAAREGYPGRHVYNVVVEKNLVRDRGWVEFSVHPLFSPQSLIAEGMASFGIEVAFPGAQRTAFERDVLYPLAGLDASRAAQYAKVHELADGLSYDLGKDLVRRFIESRGGTAKRSERRWREFVRLLSSPRMPSDLVVRESEPNMVPNSSDLTPR